MRPWRLAGPARAMRPPLTGPKVLDFDGIPHGKDIRVAGDHLFVHADTAAFTDGEVGGLGKGCVRPHADGKDHDVRRIGFPGTRPDLYGPPFQLFESHHAVVGHHMHPMPFYVGLDKGPQSPGPVGTGRGPASG